MNLISKKDLLAITGISYGQLYRWKRERLIPEEWFIKQSAYTGQETFFPREQIQSRIKSILELKDIYSLEELAKLLSPETSVETVTMQELVQIDEIKAEVLKVMPEVFGKDNFDFFEVTLSMVISQATQKIGLSNSEMEDLLRSSATAEIIKNAANVLCTVFYSGKEYHTVFSTSPVPLTFDNGIEIKELISLSEITDKIKTKYKNLFIK